MGLSVSVGRLRDLTPRGTERLDRLARALSTEGIDWHEPETTDPPGAHTFSGGFPYSYLTQLRRVLVLTNLGAPVTPAIAVSRQQYDLDRERIDDETAMLASHLLCHADDAGYYVPVDFDDPLFLPPEANVEGAGMVGSSQRLLAELAGIAPSIGIDVDDQDGPSATEETDQPFATERFTWYQLCRACRASISGGHAIVFH